MKKFYEFGLSRYIIKHYPYRTARVFGTRITFDRRTDEMTNLVDELAKHANVSPDNHVVYALVPRDPDDQPLYIWVTDDHVHIGTKLLEESW